MKSEAAIDLRELVAAIAKRHGVLFSEEDPVLVTVTLNELVLAEYVRLVSEGLEKSQRAMARTNAEHVEATRAAVANMVASSGEWLSRKIGESGRAVYEQLQVVACEVEAAAVRAREDRTAAESAAASAARSWRHASWAALAVVAVLVAWLAVAWLHVGK